MGTMGSMSEVGRIKRIAVRKPEQAFVSQEKVDREWRELNYTDRPSFVKAVTEYNQFVSLLEKFGMNIDFLPSDDQLTLDSLYVRDATIVCHNGVILCNMGKSQRRTEPEIAKTAFETCGIPVVGSITGKGQIEGGDVIWLDDHTLAVGRTYRTNDEGIYQLHSLVGEGIDIIPVPLPHYRGPSDVFHLMSIVSPIDYDLALVYSPLMPIPFRELLIDRGIHLLDVPEDEFGSMGCNVLTVAPRTCIMLSGNPKTKSLLEQAGAEVFVYTGEEISVKGQGGPTCLTRPLVRE